MYELKRIGIVKRASAWLLDAILLAVLTTGFMFCISLIAGFDAQQQLATEYYTAWEDFRKDHIADVAEFYGFTYEESEEGYTVTKDGAAAEIGDVIKALADSEGKDAETAQAYEAYLALPPVSQVNLQYEYVYNLLFMMVSVGLLLSYLILEFIVPLALKNGQTVGKKIFGICLVRPDCVKVTGVPLFARTILGKFAIETMFPVLLVFLFFFGGLGLLAIILFAGIVLLNVILFLATKNKTPIHDVIAGTVAADMKLQKMYASEEERDEHRAELAKQAAADEKEGL